MTQNAVGIIVSLESTSVASLVSLKPRVLRYFKMKISCLTLTPDLPSSSATSLSDLVTIKENGL